MLTPSKRDEYIKLCAKVGVVAARAEFLAKMRMSSKYFGNIRAWNEDKPKITAELDKLEGREG